MVADELIRSIIHIAPAIEPSLKSRLPVIHISFCAT